MASLTIRDIPEDVKRRFRQRAAANGHSMEEEGRQLILKSVGDKNRPRKSMFQILFDASRPGVDLPIPPRSPARIPTIDE